MIGIRRDILLSGFLLAASLAARAWQLPATHGIALVLGGIGTLLGVPLLPNLVLAGRIRRRRQAAQGVIARRHADPASLAAFATAHPHAQ